MKEWTKRFWNWYEQHQTLNLGIATILFSLQLVHLFWLTTDVVWSRIFDQPLLNLSGTFEWLIIFVDFTEIPALISTSLVYIYQLREKFNWKSAWFLLFLNLQLVHMFWITDEFVVQQFTSPIGLPVWLAWVAILIDYLELPVIFETLRLFIKSLKKGELNQAFSVIADKE